MLHVQLAALAFATAALLAASGCGGSSKTGSATVATATTTATTTTATTPTTPATTTTVKIATGRPLTKAHLLAKADAICARANKKLSAISIKNQSEFVRALPQVAIYNSTESNQLGKLVPPGSLAHEWEHFVNATHLYSEDVQHIATYAQTAGYQTSLPLINAAQEVHKQMRTAATQNGLVHCAEVG